MNTYGILLPCDGTEPLPVSVGDHVHIGAMVGGLIDAVTFEFDADAMEVFDAPDGADGFTAVGYINDTGLVDGLPMNVMASIMFGQELFGPVVVVSGTSPGGDYDGDNYDVPTWFADAVFGGGLHGLATMMKESAIAEADAIKLAFADGVFTEDQQEMIITMMGSGDPRHDESIANIVSMSMLYYLGRMTGTIRKFDRDAYNAYLAANIELTDEDIARFYDEMGGGN